MRVVVHVHSPGMPKSAGIQQSVRVAHYLAEAGAEVDLYFRTGSFRSQSDIARFFGIEKHPRLTIHLSAGLLRRPEVSLLTRLDALWFHTARFLRMLVREGRHIDVFFTRGIKFTWLHLLCKRWLRYKIVYELHEIFYIKQFGQEKCEKVFCPERFCYRHADAVVFIADSLRQFVEHKWGKVRPSATIPSGAILFERVALPKKHRPRNLYFVGNTHQSSLDDFIRAMPKLTWITLTIVGAGGSSHSRHLLQLAKDIGVDDRLYFSGFVEPAILPRIYEKADAFVLPYRDTVRSHYFMSPLKLFEYMSAGRPIVASDVPIFRGILVDGVNAILVPYSSPSCFAAAVQRLWDDPRLSHVLGEAAYRTVQRYAMEKKARRLFELMEGTIRG